MHSVTRRNILHAAAAAATTALAGCGGGGSSASEVPATPQGSPPPPSAPVADFSADRTSGTAPLAVAFADRSTGSIDSWNWDFGDGSSSTQRKPTHTYTTAGTYTVRLTVTGPGGTDAETRSSLLVVTAAAATRVTITGPGSAAAGRLSAPFFVSSDAPLQDSVTVTPNDGGAGGSFTPASVTLTPGAGTASFQYTAPSAGTKTIALTNNGGLANPAALGFSAIVVTWPSAIGIGSWGVIPASNTLAALNPDNDPLVNPNHPATAPWRIAGNHAGMITAWCGAAWDEQSGTMWWVDAGGHNDNYANGVYKLSLERAAPAYNRVRKPSGAVGTAAVDYAAEHAGPQQADYSDGRPRAKHTVNAQFFWPGRGPGQATEILLSPHGGASTSGLLRPYIVSESTGERTVVGSSKSNEPSGGWSAAVYDPVRNCVWKMPTSSSTRFSRWGGPDNDNWTDVGDTVYFSGSVSLCYIPGLDLILVGNGGRDSGAQSIVGGWGVFDPKTGVLYAKGMTTTFPTFAGAPTVAPAGFDTGLWPGLCQPRWAASLGAVLAWDNSVAGTTTRVMRVTPPASGDPRTGTWTIDELPVSATNAVTPSTATFNGTYGRFFVWDAARVCGVINSVDEAGFFFRYG